MGKSLSKEDMDKTVANLFDKYNRNNDEYLSQL